MTSSYRRLAPASVTGGRRSAGGRRSRGPSGPARRERPRRRPAAAAAGSGGSSSTGSSAKRSPGTGTRSPSVGDSAGLRVSRRGRRPAGVVAGVSVAARPARRRRGRGVASSPGRPARRPDAPRAAWRSPSRRSRLGRRPRRSAGEEHVDRTVAGGLGHRRGAVGMRAPSPRPSPRRLSVTPAPPGGWPSGQVSTCSATSRAASRYDSAPLDAGS